MRLREDEDGQRGLLSGVTSAEMSKTPLANAPRISPAFCPLTQTLAE